MFHAFKAHSKNVFVYYFPELNHFVPLLRLFKTSLESQGTRTMSAKRVHVSVPKIENPLSFKQNSLEFPKSTTSFLCNSCSIVSCYSSSSSMISATISSEHLLSVNSVSTIAGFSVTVSAVNACVRTSISDNVKNLFPKKKDILNFAFPKSVISLSTIDSVPAPFSLSSSVVSPSSNAGSISYNSKVAFSKFESLQSKTGDKVQM